MRFAKLCEWSIVTEHYLKWRINLQTACRISCKFSAQVTKSAPMLLNYCYFRSRKAIPHCFSNWLWFVPIFHLIQSLFASFKTIVGLTAIFIISVVGLFGAVWLLKISISVQQVWPTVIGPLVAVRCLMIVPIGAQRWEVGVWPMV